MKRKQHFSGQKVKEPVRGRKEAAAGLEKENGSGKKMKDSSLQSNISLLAPCWSLGFLLPSQGYEVGKGQS